MTLSLENNLEVALSSAKSLSILSSRATRDVEEAAVNMSKMPDVAWVSVAAYGRVIAAFKDGVQVA